MTSESPTYLFGPRERRGVFLGLGRAQLCVIAAGVLFGMAAMLSVGGGFGVLFALAALCAATLFAVLPVSGRSGAEWTPIVAGFLTRPRSWRSATPADGILLDELVPAAVDLPKELDGVRLIAARISGRTVGALYDGNGSALRAAGTFRVHVLDPYPLLDPLEQSRRITAWGEVLASLADEDSPIDRLQVTERTGAADEGTMRRYLDDQGADHADPMTAAYRELVTDAATPTAAHQILVTVRVNPGRCGKAIKAHGKGDLGLAAVLAAEVQSVADDLAGLPGIRVEPQMSPADLALTVRSAYDPGERERIAEADTAVELEPEEAWPLASDEGWSAHRTDGAAHCTLWVSELPRREVHTDFSVPLILRTEAARAVSIVYAPVGDEAATRAAERAVTADEADSKLRTEKLGQRETTRQTREASVAVRREEALNDGHALMRSSTYVTVSAPTVEALPAALTDVRRRARKAKLKTRSLFGEQAQAFTYSLPLGRGVRDKMLGGK